MALSNNPLLIPPVLPTTPPSSGLSTATGTGRTYDPKGTSVAPQCNLIWVKNFDAMMAHPTSPNEHMYFGDENDSVIYVRETDGNGQIKSPVKVLHYTIEETPIGPEAQFVTKDEHKQLYSLVEKLAGNVDSMNEKLERLLNG